VRWECPRCGVDLTELVQSGKIVITRLEPDKNGVAGTEEQVRCHSCERLVKPERAD